MADHSPNLTPPTDPDGCIHRHAEEIDRSYSRGCTERPGSAAQSPLPPVEPRPKSGQAKSPNGSRPNSATSRPRSAQSGQDIPIRQISKKDPLPPIGSEKKDEGEEEEELVGPPEVLSSVFANTMAGSEKPRATGTRYPRVVSYRPELDVDREIVVSPRQPMITRDSPIPCEITVSKDGEEVAVRSIDCQTEWSWLKDMEMVQRLSTTPGSKLSQASTAQPPTSGSLRAASQGQQEDQEGDLDLDDVHKSGPSRASDYKSSRRAASVQSPLQKSQRSSRGERRGSPTSLETAAVTGVQPGYTDDTYGIPILELSSDSESSDDEALNAARKCEDPASTLNSVGPPQILQYQRESAKNRNRKKGSAKGAEVKAESRGAFMGPCEFCGEQIKPFPSLEEQKVSAPDRLYCCDDYRQFLDVMLNQKPPEETVLIDVTPHPPHGSKQARRAAKERAAQRMRERELQRQQAAIAGMGGGGGGFGGGSGASNFYQPRAGPRSPKNTSSVPKVPDRKEEEVSDSTKTPNAHIARQMKTINYQLSSQKCLEEGWTLRPPSPLLDQDPDMEVFEPQPLLPPWAESACRDKKEGLVQKFYADGNKFVIFFPDGTGNVFYPSGQVAVTISSVEQGLYTYIAHGDCDVDYDYVVAVFDADGHAVTYHADGNVRVCLDPLGGIELDQRGCRKKRWSWKDQVEHVHAPPIQPITFAVTSNISVRILSQENVTLTFTHGSRSCRFQVGARLKLVAKENMPPQEIAEDMVYRDEVKTRIESLLYKVSNLLKFPKSPKLDKLPGPQHILNKIEKTERLRELTKSAKGDKEKKESLPVISVN